MTEPEYFHYVRLALRDTLTLVKIGSENGDPYQLVQAAVLEHKNAQRQARRHQDDNLRWDTVWCVGDTDDHPRLAEARELARQHAIQLAISNPCFELWPLLHFSPQMAFLTTKDAQLRLRQHLPGYSKSLPCDRLRGLYEIAAGRAKALEKRHADVGNHPASNPSTDVWKVVEELLDSAGGAKPAAGPPTCCL